MITGFSHPKKSPSLFDSTSLLVSHSLNTLLSDSAAGGLSMPTDGLFFSIAALLSAARLLLLLFRLAHLPACKLLPLVGRLVLLYKPKIKIKKKSLVEMLFISARVYLSES